MKKGMIYVLAALSSFMLASCTLTGTDEVVTLEPATTVADPVKPSNDGDTNVSKPETDIDVTNPGDDNTGEPDVKTNNVFATTHTPNFEIYKFYKSIIYNKIPNLESSFFAVCPNGGYTAGNNRAIYIYI